MPVATHDHRAGGLLAVLDDHVRELLSCTRCPDMIGPSVGCGLVVSRIMLLGQAPGAREGEFGRPFAWTAGKTLFKWFESLGVTEPVFRARVYMAAVCRCFPGKNPKGGDRVPNAGEVERCADWLSAEIRMLRPELIIPVGKLAISETVGPRGGTGLQMKDVVGRAQRVTLFGHELDAIPLPHPSGASTWHRTEPGKTLLERALGLIDAHPAFAAMRAGRGDTARDHEDSQASAQIRTHRKGS